MASFLYFKTTEGIFKKILKKTPQKYKPVRVIEYSYYYYF